MVTLRGAVTLFQECGYKKTQDELKLKTYLRLLRLQSRQHSMQKWQVL